LVGKVDTAPQGGIISVSVGGGRIEPDKRALR
jgi:hypothetical protein